MVYVGEDVLFVYFDEGEFDVVVVGEVICIYVSFEFCFVRYNDERNMFLR